MLNMVAAINGDFLAKLTARREPTIVVNCATCHRGVAHPRTRQQLLLTAFDAAGVDSLDRAYRALRKWYFGSAAYEFGEVTLSDVAEALLIRKNSSDAVRVHLLNTEMSPTSSFACWMAGATQLSAGDASGAVSSLRKAVALNPSNQGALGLLQRLGQKPLN